MEPDSEETRMILDFGGRREEVKREWIMKGTEMDDVAVLERGD
jgi:hypothetical protein